MLSIGNPDFSALPAESSGLGAAKGWGKMLQGADPASVLARVKGDFAVAQALPDGRVLLAVDRFAIRSLCWRIVDGQIRVASRADELADDGTPVDPQALFDYLYFHAIPSPRTVFSGVQRLPPGHMLVFDKGRVELKAYWVPSFDESGAAPFEQLRERFLKLLGEAVHRRLDGTKPACFLSGGTDSSTVAGMIERVAGTPAHSYSIGFEAQGYDEMEYARIASRAFKTIHHEYYVTPDDLVRNIANVAGHYDQPFGNSSALPAYYCALRAREDGVSHILAGDGGDELFGGNVRYAKQRVFDWYRKIPGTLRSGVVEPLLERSHLGTLPLVRKATSYVGQAKVPMPDRLDMYNLLLRLGIRQVLTDDFLAQVEVGGPLLQQQEVWRAAQARHEIDRTLAYDWRYTLAESDLPKVNVTTQLAGLSVGFPLLDDDLLAFSMGLPPGHKLRGLKLRWFFKEALRGFLPDEIINKKKHGFGLPFGVWASTHTGLKALATDSLGSLAQRGIVRAEFIHELLRTHLPAHPGYYGEMVWILMVLEQWLQQHSPEARWA